MFIRKLKDLIAKRFMLAVTCFITGIFFLVVLVLFIKSLPVLSSQPITQILFSANWRPMDGHFGLLAFILGTLWVTSIAVILAVPLSILTAIYLSEYAPVRVRETIRPIIDLLAGISPVIYGLFGMIAIVPLVRDYLMPFFSERLHFFPFASDNFTGFSAITAGIVLAVMISPIIISVTQEVIDTVPKEIKEASLSLGSTKWEVTKYVTIKKVRAGIIAAIILGLSRSVGETMAVLMIAGCSLGVFTASVFDTAYPLSALIANTYGEMMSIPLYDSAVMLAALILLIVTTIFNIIGWSILLRLEKEEI